MSKSFDIKWIKIATGIFSDEKILLIEQMPEGDSIIVIWFKLLCMAGKENNCGVFVMGGKIPYTEEMLSTIFRRKLSTVQLALKTFEAFGMIEIISDNAGNNVYTIPNWQKHQSAESMDKIREQTRKRVAKHREQQRIAVIGESEKSNSADDSGNTDAEPECCNVTCNVTVTESNAPDKIREDKIREDKIREDKIREDKIREDKIREEKNNKKKSAPYVADDDLNNAILAFIDYRKKIKKPMTERAVQLLITELNKLSPDIVTQIEILNQSILNGWQGVFPLKQQTKKEIVPDWINKNSFNYGMMKREYDVEQIEKDLLAQSYEGCSENPDFAAQKEAAEKRIKDICCS